MTDSRAFFNFQLTFAQRFADRFQLPLAETIYHYTTFRAFYSFDDIS